MKNIVIDNSSLIRANQGHSAAVDAELEFEDGGIGKEHRRYDDTRSPAGR
ncbi:MAG: hypothetical protein ILN61_09510 [Lachnospiraceae bacterium]|nr:hypothetical protein [Lachnospiraceae bacterium]